MLLGFGSNSMVEFETKTPQKFDLNQVKLARIRQFFPFDPGFSFGHLKKKLRAEKTLKLNLKYKTQIVGIFNCKKTGPFTVTNTQIDHS